MADQSFTGHHSRSFSMSQEQAFGDDPDSTAGIRTELYVQQDIHGQIQSPDEPSTYANANFNPMMQHQSHLPLGSPQPYHVSSPYLSSYPATSSISSTGASSIAHPQYQYMNITTPEFPQLYTTSVNYDGLSQLLDAPFDMSDDIKT